MTDLLTLNESELDALREVASIGAGHAATALSQMTGSAIMISVPRISIAPVEDVPTKIAEREEPVAGVLMQMLGDLRGRTLLVFPRPTAMRLAELMLHRVPASARGFGELERSAITEAGNILSGAYMNALSEFLGLVLLPSPPSMSVDESPGILGAAFLEMGGAGGHVFAAETQYFLQDRNERLRGFFLLLPDPASLHVILRAVRVS